MTLPDDTGDLVLLHNPRCSKSRQVKALLDERGAQYTERRYLEDPLSIQELDELSKRLGLRLREWVRTKEAAFEEAGLNSQSSDESVAQAVASHPILMERPILVGPLSAMIGRPPECVLALIPEGPSGTCCS